MEQNSDRDSVSKYLEVVWRPLLATVSLGLFGIFANLAWGVWRESPEQYLLLIGFLSLALVFGAALIFCLLPFFRWFWANRRMLVNWRKHRLKGITALALLLGFLAGRYLFPEHPQQAQSAVTRENDVETVAPIDESLRDELLVFINASAIPAAKMQYELLDGIKRDIKDAIESSLVGNYVLADLRRTERLVTGPFNDSDLPAYETTEELLSRTCAFFRAYLESARMVYRIGTRDGYDFGSSDYREWDRLNTMLLDDYTDHVALPRFEPLRGCFNADSRYRAVIPNSSEASQAAPLDRENQTQEVFTAGNPFPAPFKGFELGTKMSVLRAAFPQSNFHSERRTVSLRSLEGLVTGATYKLDSDRVDPSIVSVEFILRRPQPEDGVWRQFLAKFQSYPHEQSIVEEVIYWDDIEGYKVKLETYYLTIERAN